MRSDRSEHGVEGREAFVEHSRFGYEGVLVLEVVQEIVRRRHRRRQELLDERQHLRRRVRMTEEHGGELYEVLHERMAILRRVRCELSWREVALARKT